MSVVSKNRAVLERDPFNAFISFTEETGRGEGVAVKDSVRVRGTFTTGGGAVRPDEPDDDDALIVKRLRERGHYVIGKTNLDEWGAGATGENAHYGRTLNPRAPNRLSGGSSSGSAAAVAGGLCDWAIGTDSGGSVRIPAALCGVVGFKPTTGALPADGIIPRSRTLGTPGVLAPDVGTAQRAYACLATEDFVDQAVPLDSVRFGIFEVSDLDLDESVLRAWQFVRGTHRGVRIPGFAEMVSVQRTIVLFEASREHRDRLASAPHAYSAHVRKELERGAGIADEEYSLGLDRRLAFRRDFEQVLGDVDVLVLPTAPCVAPLPGTPGIGDRLSSLTRPISVSGHPAVSIPVPTAGLPVGLQFVARLGMDLRLLQIARGVEMRLAAAGGAAPL